MPTALILLAAAAALQGAPPKNHGNEPLAPPPAASVAIPETGPDLSTADAALSPLMDRIEARIVMPAGAAPLAGHARFYAWADKGRSKVTAVYLAVGAPGRKWVGFDDLPAFDSGACAVVALVYDVRSASIDEIGCG